jgi:hypothetical protein
VTAQTHSARMSLSGGHALLGLATAQIEISLHSRATANGPFTTRVIHFVLQPPSTAHFSIFPSVTGAVDAPPLPSSASLAPHGIARWPS